MKLLIVGSKGLSDYYKLIDKSIKYAEGTIDIKKVKKIVCFDKLVSKWAENNFFKTKMFEVDWLNIEKEGAIVREGTDGTKYNAKAGYERNEEAAKYSNILLAIYKEGDKSLEHLIDLFKQSKKKVVVYEV